MRNGGGNDGEDALPEDADERARAIIEAVSGVVAELVLDLEVTWVQARDIFAATLFDRAEKRYETGPRIAAALDTSVRTVRMHRRKRREPRDPTMFNLRRRVLHLLNDGPRTFAEIEGRLPRGSDVNFAQGAVESLVADGLIVERADGLLSLPEENFRPWYLRPEVYDVERLQRRLDYFARLLSSRVSPLAEQADPPAALVGLYVNLAPEQIRPYMENLRATLAAFDAQWERIAAETKTDTADHVLVGGVFAFGRLGTPLRPGTFQKVEDEGDAQSEGGVERSSGPGSPTVPIG